MVNEAYIYDAVRTPRGRGKADGALSEVTPTQLLVTALQALRERNHLDTSRVEDVIIGCLTQVMEQASDIAKVAAQAAGYDDVVAGVTLNRFCASGLEAVNQAAAYLMSGMVNNFIIAGGVESMSRIKLGSDGGAWYMDPQVAFPGYFVPQGVAADLIATKYGYSRADVDGYAVESHQRAASAQAGNKLKKSLIPVKDINGFTILDRDETVRPETTLATLNKLPASFETMGLMAGFDAVAIQRYPEVESLRHVHHAGNSSGVVDGASVVLLGNKRIGEETGLKPRAKIRSFAITGTDPTIMLLGPMPATRKALQRAGLGKDAIDLYEVNEAFAVVVLRFMDEMGIPHEKINVNGGAIAYGHPIGATGGMLIGTVLDELERQDKQFGLCTLCVGGGMGIATIIERI